MAQRKYLFFGNYLRLCNQHVLPVCLCVCVSAFMYVRALYKCVCVGLNKITKIGKAIYVNALTAVRTPQLMHKKYTRSYSRFLTSILLIPYLCKNNNNIFFFR